MPIVTGPSKRLVRAMRRHRVAELVLQKWKQEAIGKELGISQAQVSKDLKQVEADWKERATVPYEKKINEELALIDLVESEAWEQWHRSKLDTKAQSVKKKSGAKKKPGAPPEDEPLEATVKTAGRLGNPAFLNIVQECHAKRANLLGLEAPKLTGSVNGVDAPGIVERAVARAQAYIAERLKTLATPPEGEKRTDDEEEQPPASPPEEETDAGDDGSQG